MKTWNAPVMQELDVRLTASGSVASTSEEAAGGGIGDWSILATYNSETSERNPNINDTGVDDGCISEIKQHS